ncbi:MAG TPA: HlyD family efflux transporter periplasmic adaptor subunit [Fimbriimonas sp.]
MGDQVAAGAPLAEIAIEPRDGSASPGTSNSPYLQNYKRDRVNRTLDDLREAEDRLRIAQLPRGREEVQRQELEVARRRSAISEAEARVRAAKAQSGDPLKIDIARQEAARAAAKLEFVSKKLDRDRVLLDREVIARAELDQTQRDYDVAKAEHSEAALRLKLAESLPGTDEVAAAQAELDQARIAYESERTLLHQMRKGSSSEEVRRANAQLARAQAAYRSSLSIPDSSGSPAPALASGSRLYVLRAPIGGMVVARNLNVGEVAAYVIPRADRSVGAYHEARSSFVVADTRRLEFKGLLPHSMYSSVRPGVGVRVRLDSQPDAPLEGTVTRAAPVAASETGASGVFPVWIRLSSTRPLLLGERGTIEIGDSEGRL